MRINKDTKIVQSEDSNGKYSYYVVTYLDGGILRKMFRGKKFKSVSDAVSKVNVSSFLSTSELVILKYTGEYKSIIAGVIKNSNQYIFEPIE